MNKKILGLLIVFASLSCMLFAVSKERKAIDDFLAEYEKFVVKAEKAAESNKISDLTNLSLESLTLSEKAQKVESAEEWTLSDSMKYLDLTNRYAAAIDKLSGSSSSTTTATTDDYNDLLKSFGF